MNTIERLAKLTPNKQSLLTVWLGQHKNGSTADDAEKQLVAYVVMKNGTRDTAPLREYLKGQTPAYMVPDAFVPLDSLPLTTNGKIDRQRLSAPPKTSTIDDNFVAPRTQLEEDLAGLWSEVLKVERVGINDNFFDLGGHSLLCLQMVARIEQATGTRVSPRLLLLNTLGQVAAQLRARQLDG